MTMPQTRHYEMKDSGVEWIGKMPSHWSASPFKKIIAQNDGGVWGEDPIDNDGAVVLRSTEQTVDGKWNIEQPAKRDLSHVAKLRYYKLEIGDLLITKSSGSALHIGKTSIVDADIAKLHCFYSNFMQRVRLNQNVMPKLYWYILNSSIARYQFVFLQNSTSGIGNINSKHIDNIIVPVPPLVEQTAIAAYLDEKCATIDAIIAEAKATIEEYKAWRASVIFETVTKGLNPNAKMKDSGVEWIGEMPKGWNLMPFGKIASIKACLVPPKEYPLLPQISPDNIEKGSARLLQNYKTVQESGVISWNHHFYKGQIIYSKVRPTLNKLFLAQFEGLCSADMYPIETTQDARYLVYAMLSGYFVQQVAAITANRVKMPKINKQELSKITVLLPPLSEQASIVSYLDRKCSLIDAIILEKEDLIRELENYKRSLIFEVVTGKRRVC